ncbi:NADH-quinone oxidoreductase subunit NuoE [Maritalea sp.]|uniref:NADH-quinone oxidoreductase subunit NuoE n=1 Tax=Maritalea sp. TaxID=2003361 RepID=UPI003EF5C457
MSVRRLAEDQVQPEGFAFNAQNKKWAKQTIAKYPKGRQQSAVIPLLMRAQDQDGWVTKRCIEHVADMLEMPYIRVLEVATFYTQFQLKPVGTKAHIQVCGTTPCMLRGSEELIKVCKSKINAKPFEPNASGTLSWEEVECLGACVNAPMMMVFKDTYEDLTPERLEEIIDEFEAGKDVKTGTQIDRQFSAPEGGAVTLTDVPARKPVKASNDKPAAKPTSKPKATPLAKAEAPNAPVKKPTAKNTSAKASAAKATASKPKSADGDNAPLFEAPAGDKDDLKLISGVGPVLEGKLNALGITQFAQVAKFTKKQIADVDDRLSFRGRIERDNWKAQAKALAKGGAEEYRKVFGKDPR